MPTARPSSVSRPSFQIARRFPWPSEKSVMAILLAVFFALHVIAGMMLQARNQGDVPEREEKEISVYD